ncbi:MAG: hypothetical protein FJX29_02135 [Alphaproteobacteria bacterium]|nr:hypothetical protein [Alphaproteobacteria bacterium]
MTLSGLALVLTAALCHAVWNFLVKRVNGGAEFIWLFSAISGALYLPAVLYVLFIQKSVPGWWQFAVICGSGVLHLGYFLLLQQGYRRGELSLVYPAARATGPLLASAFAVLVLGEKMSVQSMLGAMAIIAGVLCLTRAYAGFTGLAGGRMDSTAGVSLAFGVATGVLIACYTVWDAWAVAALLISPILLDYASMGARVILLYPYAMRHRQEMRAQWRDHWPEVLGVAALSPLAYILVLYALTFTPVTYVAPARETSVLISVMLGMLLLGEGREGGRREIIRRLGWASVIIAGMAALTSG